MRSSPRMTTVGYRSALAGTLAARALAAAAAPTGAGDSR